MTELQFDDLKQIWNGTFKFDIKDKKLAKNVNIIHNCISDMNLRQIELLMKVLHEKCISKFEFEYKTKKRLMCYHLKYILQVINHKAFPPGVDKIVYDYIDFGDYVKINYKLDISYCSDVAFHILMSNPTSINKEDEWLHRLMELADRQNQFKY